MQTELDRGRVGGALEAALRHRLTRLLQAPSDGIRTTKILPIRPQRGDGATTLAEARFDGDSCKGGKFCRRASIALPNLISLLDLGDQDGSFTDVMVNVKSSAFASDHSLYCEVIAWLGGEEIDRHVFHKWYGQHQFFIPLQQIRKRAQHVSLAVVFAGDGTEIEDAPEFEVELFACSKPGIKRRLARGSIWLFSTARSGSTWLAADILCADDRARLIDESGLGRMFAPLQMDAERFFDLGGPKTNGYVESGFLYETHAVKRKGAFRPVFERTFVDMARESQMFRRQTSSFYHKTLRDVALAHLGEEWGCRDFERVVFKCPNDGQAADIIMKAFPEAHMVFLMRDGRDVMKSRFSPFGSPLLARSEDAALRMHAIVFYSHLWNFQVDIIRSAFDAHPSDRRTFLKYEDIRREPEASIAPLMRELGFHLSAAAVRRLADGSRLENMPSSERGADKPRQSGVIGGFRSAFSESEIAVMDGIMGPNLRRFGYGMDGS